MRPSGRAPDQLRSVVIETGATKHAEGSCLIRMGETHVLCTASIEGRTPPWMRNSGLGWVTAEYGMLPRATHTRNRREASVGKISGRTQEIQRLIGRSLRAGTDRVMLGERQITVDCDVLQADAGELKENPITQHVAAVSCGVYEGRPVLDLDYAEDSEAGTDANVVMTGAGGLVEVQGSAEGATFSRGELDTLLNLAEAGIAELVAAQKAAVGG